MRTRKNIRLKNWDYSSGGNYFVTICCHERISYFGKIENNAINLSEIGSVASKFWIEIPKHFPHVKLDEFIIMPNHLHGIIILDYSLVGTCHGMSLPMPHDVTGHHKNEFSKPLKNSISIIINQFKSSVKRWCNNNGHVNFVWQSRFYDHIINDQASMENVRAYIKNNPLNWSGDDLFI